VGWYRKHKSLVESYHPLPRREHLEALRTGLAVIDLDTTLVALLGFTLLTGLVGTVLVAGSYLLTDVTLVDGYHLGLLSS